MRLAIDEAKIGETPYGCVIVKDNQVIVQAYNTVRSENDPTAQAEVNAIRKLCQLLEPGERKDCMLFTICEPTPLSMSAIFYSGVKKIVYGVPIEKMSGISRKVSINAKEFAERCSREIVIKGGKLQNECLELFTKFHHA